MGGKDFDIVKLSGSDNFHTWKFAVEAVLEFQELNETIVCESATDPTTSKEADTTKLTQTRALLKLAVEPHIYAHLEGCETALAIWTKLKTSYEDRGLLRRITLLYELISIRLEDCDGVQNYVDQLRATSNRLTGVGFKIDDTWLAAMMLAGLTDEFKTLIMGLESTNTDVTTDLVTGKLLDMKNFTAKNGEAFFSKKSWKKKVRKCYECGSEQHLSNACDKRDKNSEKVKSGKNNKKDKRIKRVHLCSLLILMNQIKNWTNGILIQVARLICHQATMECVT